MEWDDRFSVGIKEIDQQHKILLDYFALLHDAIEGGGRWSDVHFPLVQLKEYAHIHFMMEEALMGMSDYPGTQEHIEAHRKIIQQLEELEQKSLHKNLKVQDADFLRDWLMGHMLKTDRDYARHFANGGKIMVKET